MRNYVSNEDEFNMSLHQAILVKILFELFEHSTALERGDFLF